MQIATFNANSIRQRAPHVQRWLEQHTPELAFLQELKCEETQFPAMEFSALGYQAHVVGQKAYNGVALLSRVPVEIVHRRLPGLAGDDIQARYIEAKTADITAIGIYLPNGNSGGEAGFAYKLRWMDLLIARARALADADAPFAILGDFNACPTDADYAPGALSPNDALLRPEVRARYRTLINLGLTDALRALHPNERIFTFWDYQAGAWERDSGLLIDHALLSPALAERLVSITVDKYMRGETQPSDHVPVRVELR